MKEQMKSLKVYITMNTNKAYQFATHNIKVARDEQLSHSF